MRLSASSGHGDPWAGIGAAAWEEWTRSGARGAPGTARSGDVSKSATKAPRGGIDGEKKRGISTILFRRSGSIGAFVADLDKRHRGPREGPTGRAAAAAGAPIGRAGPRERRSPMCNTPASGPRREGAVPPRNPEGYSGVVLKTWGVKIVVAVCSGHLRARRWSRARRDRPVRSSGAVRAASGAVPAPRPRFAPIAHLAWRDGVSHVVTRPGSRARHSTLEHVTQPARSSLNPRARLPEVRARGSSDVLGGYPAISRTAAPGAAAPRTPRRALRPRERRSDHRGPAERKWSAQESATMSPLNNLPGEPHWPPGSRADMIPFNRVRRSGRSFAAVTTRISMSTDQ